ncbi:hypothetical protein MHK_002287, partial [Candidatus Magnetomorum sp. HK-1]
QFSVTTKAKIDQFWITITSTRLQRLFFFIDYLDARNVRDVNDITSDIISDYVKTIYPSTS